MRNTLRGRYPKIKPCRRSRLCRRGSRFGSKFQFVPLHVLVTVVAAERDPLRRHRSPCRDQRLCAMRSARLRARLTCRPSQAAFHIVVGAEDAAALVKSLSNSRIVSAAIRYRCLPVAPYQRRLFSRAISLDHWRFYAPPGICLLRAHGSVELACVFREDQLSSHPQANTSSSDRRIAGLILAAAAMRTHRLGTPQ